MIGINQFTIQFPKIDSLLGKTIIHQNLFICSNYYIFTQTKQISRIFISKCVSLALKNIAIKSLVSAFISSVSHAASTAPHRELSKKSYMGVQQRAHM